MIAKSSSVVALLVAASLASGCAFGLPLTSSGHASSDSKFERCETLLFIVGVLIDSIIIAGDVAYGDKVDGYDALLFVTVGLDVAFGGALQSGCHSD